MLLGFDSSEAAGQCVSAIIAAGIIPVAIEFMDRPAIHVCEAFAKAGYPMEVEALLIIEVEGSGEEIASLLNVITELAKPHKPRDVRISQSAEQSAAIWKGRKSAFGAIARIAPDYYLHDAVVPRTRLVEVLRQVYAIADEQQLTMMNVFHAGDGNLHPLIVFDAREPGVWERVHRAGDEIIAACVAAGGVLSGEHGIGVEKRDAMPLVFSPDDLDAQARLRDAFDPSGRANPGKVLPSGSRCGELPRVPEGAWI
jgi:glycolate oxidase